MSIRRLLGLLGICALLAFFGALAYKHWYVQPKAFHEELVDRLKNHASPVWNKAIFGRDDWLFFRPDLEYLLNPIPPETMQQIIAFSATLKAHGITLYVVPVPTKTEVYPEMLTAAKAPAILKKARTDLLKKLSDKGVKVIDLLPSFLANKSSIALFEGNESHWTPKGIAFSAHIIATAIDTSLVNRKFPQSQEYTLKDTVFPSWGDMRDKINPWNGHTIYSLPVPRVFTKDNVGFTDDPTSKLLILGDSFVDRARWWHANLGAHLAFETRYSTRTFCSLLANTEGPCMYERLPAVFPENGVVIWAFTSRVLQYHLCSKPLPSKQ